MSKTELQEMYMSYLKREGYAAHIDDDGDIVVKQEGKMFLIHIDEGDPGFFQLTLPMFWKVESDIERENAIVAIERVAATVRVAKCYLVREYVWASYEAHCMPPESFQRTFPRAIRCARKAARTFADHMSPPRTSGILGRA